VPRTNRFSGNGLDLSSTGTRWTNELMD